MKKFIFMLSVLSAVFLSSCVTFKADGLAFTTANENVQVLGNFSKKKTVHELFGTSGGTNLFNISATAMNEKITGIIWQEIQKKGGNAARNISITYSAGPLAYIANVITFGIWAPASLKVTGEVIKTNSQTAQIDTENAIDVAISDFKQ